MSTFAFIDPFGYSAASMSLAGRFLDFPRCEALVFLPLSFVHRFVTRDGQAPAMTALFGGDEWKAARKLEGEERRAFLLDLFERARWAPRARSSTRGSFALRTRDGNDYWLVFATGHRRGLELIKDAMWTLHPEVGHLRHCRHRRGPRGPFTAGPVDTRPLLAQLRAKFGTDGLPSIEAADVTLFETPFHPSKHLKRLTLKPAEDGGAIEVERPEGRRRGSFGDDVRMRFVS